MPDFSKMTPTEFAAWQQEQNNPPGGNVTVALPAPTPPQAPLVEVRPAAQVWGSTEFDFTCPSGALCRMRKLMPEAMVEAGILDKVATLPGVAAEVIEKAEGAPPKPAGPFGELPSKEDMRAIIEVLEVLVPMVVVEPRVYPNPPAGEERVAGRIYTDSIELQDRIAIMERAVYGVKKLEPFRAGSGQPV